jgi:hypothetical protein
VKKGKEEKKRNARKDKLQGARCKISLPVYQPIQSTGHPVYQSASQENAKDKMKVINAGWRIVIAREGNVGKKIQDEIATSVFSRQ